jgi:hypothetical protein
MAAEHNAALTAAALELRRLQAENETLREDLHTVQSEATEFLKRLRLAEQQNETLSDQLIAVQEAYEDKLRSVHDDAGAEREQWESQRTLELRALRERSEQEREMLEREMKAAVAKIESDLQSDADQLQRLLRDGKDQTNALKTQIAMLQTELKAARAERQQQAQSDASLSTKCESLQRSHDHWEAKCQSLQDQVHQLLHEHDDWRRQAAVEREQKKILQRTTCERLASQVRVLQTQLRTLATGTRELIQSELKKSTQLLAQWQQHASEVAIQHNDKAMALVAKQNRIIQLESQLKNERQSVVQLDASLAKTTRALQRKDELFRAKYQEQKEYLDITVAVRNGLTHELQSKKQKLDQLEMRLRDAGLARDAADKKNKLLVQQVKIMQHAHAREMEQVALGQQHEQCTTRRRSNDAPTLMKSRRPSLRGSATGHKPLRTADTTTHAAAPTDQREREEVERSGRRWLPEDAAEGAFRDRPRHSVSF